MNYKKIKKDNYILHLINNDRFKTVNVTIRFTKKFDKKEGAYLKLLSKVLAFNGTKNYPNLKDLSKRLEYLYSASLSYNFFAVSKNMVFETNLNILNPKYVNVSLYEEAFDVLKETLTNPIIKMKKFKNDVFETEKETLIKSILNIKDVPSNYATVKFEELFYKNTVYEEDNYKNIEIFKKLENEKLYQVYNSLFSEFKIDVIVMGEYNEEVIIKNIDELLSSFKSKNNFYKDLYINIDKEKEEVKEKIESTQSNLLVGLTIDNLTDEERDYKLVLYNTILGCMNNSVLFVNVREKNSLCYHIGSTINRFTDTIQIDSGINKKNYDKAISLITKSLEEMKNEKVINALITNAKKTLLISYNDYYDNQRKIIDYYYLNEFVNIPDVEERRGKVLETTTSDIINIAKKISINTIYLLEGSINEEN